jgi:hypothetical protein
MAGGGGGTVDQLALQSALFDTTRFTFDHEAG